MGAGVVDLYKLQIQEDKVTQDDLRLELERQLDTLKSVSCVQQTELMYGAFVDNICLGSVVDPSAQDIHPVSEGLLENTFLGGLELNVAWLTVLFCACM